MQLSAVFGFALIALALIAVPGPDWAFILAAGARDHAVARAVSGLMLGYTIITALVAAGVGALLVAVPAALIGLTVVGSGYLLYLGVRTLSGAAAPGAGQPAARPSAGYVWRGAGVSALNPKGLLIFLSILPQFTRPAAGWPVPVQLAVLGGVFVALTALCYVPLGYASDRMLGSRPGVARVISRLAGVAMIVVGLALLAERLLEMF